MEICSPFTMAAVFSAADKHGATKIDARKTERNMSEDLTTGSKATGAYNGSVLWLKGEFFAESP
jgi:hypothetical protein